jgi:hypothetical protein
MANTIQIKRSSTAGSAPTASQLAQGELAVNLVDKRMFTKNASNAVVELTHCRAWVNFNGTGTVAIRASHNVTSITDFEPGVYGVNFTTPMPDANYAAVSTAEGVGGFAMRVTTCSQHLTTAVNVRCSTVGTSTPLETDNTIMSVAVFR